MQYARISAAIDHDTGGFIWYGTPKAVGSSYINGVELPAALARKRREDRYPLVPLFADLPRNVALVELKNVLTAEDLALLTDTNGIVRARQRREEFHEDTARRYLRAAIRLRSDTVAVRSPRPQSQSLKVPGLHTRLAVADGPGLARAYPECARSPRRRASHDPRWNAPHSRVPGNSCSISTFRCPWRR